MTTHPLALMAYSLPVHKRVLLSYRLGLLRLTHRHLAPRDRLTIALRRTV